MFGPLDALHPTGLAKLGLRWGIPLDAMQKGGNCGWAIPPLAPSWRCKVMVGALQAGVLYLRDTVVSVLASLAPPHVGLTCLLPPECLAVSHGLAAGLQTSDPR